MKICNLDCNLGLLAIQSLLKFRNQTYTLIQLCNFSACNINHRTAFRSVRYNIRQVLDTNCESTQNCKIVQVSNSRCGCNTSRCMQAYSASTISTTQAFYFGFGINAFRSTCAPEIHKFHSYLFCPCLRFTNILSRLKQSAFL